MTPEQAEAQFVIGTLCEACDAIEAGGLGIDAPLTIHNPQAPGKRYVLMSETAWKELTRRKEQP